MNPEKFTIKAFCKKCGDPATLKIGANGCGDPDCCGPSETVYHLACLNPACKETESYYY